MVEVAANLGVDGIRFSLTIERAHQVRPSLVEKDNALLFARAHQKAADRAARLGIPLSITRLLHGDYPELVQLKAS